MTLLTIEVEMFSEFDRREVVGAVGAVLSLTVIALCFSATLGTAAQFPLKRE
jgi:hypothetical protein